MAIASVRPTRQEVIGKDIPLIQPNDYKGVVNNLKHTPEESLVYYTNGYEWTCDYYSQITNSSNDLKALDPSQSKVYQQYNKIKSFIIKVEDPLSESQDNVNKLMSVGGSGVVTNGIVPEAGDMFIADVGIGKPGLFTITKTDRKSYFTQSVFQIDYTLLGYVESNISRVSDMENKVINTYRYNRLYNNFSEGAIISENSYITQKSLLIYQQEFIDYFFSNFWSHNFSTFIVPKQNFPIYDPFMMIFIRKILNVLDNYKFQECRVLNTNYDCGLAQPVVLTVLVNKQKNLIPVTNKYMGLASTAYYAGNPLLLSIAYSGLAYTVYPVLKSINPGVLENDPMTFWGYSFDGPLANMPSALTGECSGLPLSEHHLQNELITYNGTTVAGKNIPLVKPAFFSNTYIFSSDFYKQTGEYSLLEALVWQYLKDEYIDSKQLNMICDDYINWTAFDQFYYLPVLILLIKYVLRKQ